jgi:hypothetical protein
MEPHDPPLCWQGLRLPKRGHALDEYEDACAGNAAAGRFAVADGATESSFAAEWARLLVERFVAEPTGGWSDWLPTLRQRWAAEVGGRDLPWYAEAKFEQGAFATFLGVAMEVRQAQGRWRAVAVGDSCLFHIRQDRLLRAFPLTRSADFGSHPDLVRSRPPDRPSRRPKRRRARGTWEPHDRLLLMTDALAQWFLKQAEQGEQPWRSVEESKTDVDFGAWVEDLRDRGELRNDDVTLLTIRPRGGAEPAPTAAGI